MAAHDCEPSIQEAKAQGHIPRAPSSQTALRQHSKEIHVCGPAAPLTASRESNPPACHHQVHLQSRWGQRASSLLSLYLTSYTVWSPGSHSACVREKIYPTVLYSVGWFPVI